METYRNKQTQKHFSTKALTKYKRKWKEMPAKNAVFFSEKGFRANLATIIKGLKCTVMYEIRWPTIACLLQSSRSLGHLFLAAPKAGAAHRTMSFCCCCCSYFWKIKLFIAEAQLKVCWFRNVFLVFWILPKNKGKQFNLRYHTVSVVCTLVCPKLFFCKQLSLVVNK